MVNFYSSSHIVWKSHDLEECCDVQEVAAALEEIFWMAPEEDFVGSDIVARVSGISVESVGATRADSILIDRIGGWNRLMACRDENKYAISVEALATDAHPKWSRPFGWRTRSLS